MAIYLDYAATTPMIPNAITAMVDACRFDGHFGNAGSRSHVYGWRAEELVEQARLAIAAAIGAENREIIFTSGATESNNLALKGIAQMYASKGRHLITSEIEHKSILDVMRYLELHHGCEVTYLKPQASGLIAPKDLAAALRSDTILVSLMLVNNEIGSINPISDLSQLARSYGAFFHVDAAQALGKIPLNVEKLGVDLISFSGHKIYGPKGIGGLYVRRKPRVRLFPQQHGGGQERGMRSGTLAVPLIAAFGVAVEEAAQHLDEHYNQLLKLKMQLWEGLSTLPATYLNGTLEHSCPSILNVSFEGVEGESLLMGMSNIAVSSGSACTSQSLEPSYVLKAIGCDEMLAHSSIRFSFGHGLSSEDIAQTITETRRVVERLRRISPIWEMRESGIDLSSVNWQHAD